MHDYRNKNPYEVLNLRPSASIPVIERQVRHLKAVYCQLDHNARDVEGNLLSEVFENAAKKLIDPVTRTIIDKELQEQEVTIKNTGKLFSLIKTISTKCLLNDKPSTNMINLENVEGMLTSTGEFMFIRKIDDKQILNIENNEIIDLNSIEVLFIPLELLIQKDTLERYNYMFSLETIKIIISLIQKEFDEKEKVKQEIISNPKLVLIKKINI